MRRARAHLFVGTLDQLASSGSNVILAIFVARSSSQAGFGLFSLVAMSFAMTLGLNRTFFAEPYVVWSGFVRSRNALVDGARSIVGAALLVGVLLALVTGIAISVLAQKSLPLGIWLMLGFMPVLAVQDVLRLIAFAWKRSQWALLSDSVWLVGLAGVAVLGLAPRSLSADVVIGAWGAAGVVATLVLIFALSRGAYVGESGSGNTPDGGLRALVKRQGGPAGGEYLALTGSLQLTYYIAGSVLGVAGIAGPRGAVILMGPLTVLFSGVSQAAFPLLAQRKALADMSWHIVGMQAIFVSAAGLLVAGFLFVPDTMGVQILGESWYPSREVLIPGGVSAGLLGLAIPLLIGIRMRGQSHALFRVRVFIAPLYLIVGAIADRLGSYWFMWALTGVMLVDLLCIYLISRSVQGTRSSESPGHGRST